MSFSKQNFFKLSALFFITLTLNSCGTENKNDSNHSQALLKNNYSTNYAMNSLTDLPTQCPDPNRLNETYAYWKIAGQLPIDPTKTVIFIGAMYDTSESSDPEYKNGPFLNCYYTYSENQNVLIYMSFQDKNEDKVLPLFPQLQKNSSSWKTPPGFGQEEDCNLNLKSLKYNGEISTSKCSFHL
jgi:hypothetical protein